MDKFVYLFVGVVAACIVVALTEVTAAHETETDQFNSFNPARQLFEPCRTIRIPPRLCRSCPMLPFTANGTHTGSKHGIFDIDDRNCKKQIQKYLDANTCDSATKRAVDENDRDRINFFMYGVCEQCCDCIPIGSRVGEYDDRKKTNRLLTTRRGNCVAHFFIDVCRIWPDVEHITSLTGKEVRRARVCPLMDEWFASNKSLNWVRSPRVEGLKVHARRALRSHLSKARCGYKRIWEDCVRLELSDSRI